MPISAPRCLRQDVGWVDLWGKEVKPGLKQAFVPRKRIVLWKAFIVRDCMGVAANAFNLSTWELAAGGLPV